MYKCLNPRAVGIALDWEACLPLAAENGFQGIDVDLDQEISPSEVRDSLKRHDLKPGGCGLPLQFRGERKEYEEGLKALPAICRMAREIGVSRFPTWILPYSDDLPWKENFRLHAERLGEAARILADNGGRLGLEFLGPRTLRQGHRYSFVHTLQQMLELAEAVGPNAGLLLDAWHWHTSLGTVEDIESLDASQVVTVHINDAPSGIPVEQQIDTIRRLPGDTGVIDLTGFLGALRGIGYDGPVVPEPFVKELGEMPPGEAAALVGAALGRVWGAAGLTGGEHGEKTEADRPAAPRKSAKVILKPWGKERSARSELRYRQVHLDFHTSEHIPDVGLHFDPERFTAVLKKARVNSVTVFARGHHGWCYYPSRIGKPHPNLKRPDLLGEMVSACRKADINVPVYLTVQWDERMAREHPEWRVMSANPAGGSARDGSAMNQLSAAWHPLCLNHAEYVDYVIRMTEEVMDRYRPDGLFMDILLPWECVCPACLASMAKDGRDPGRRDDRLANDRDVIMRYYGRSSEAVWSRNPDMRLFHNSGHVYKGERDRYRCFSHLEIESLPTGGWGYDHFPVSARYAATLGMEYLGMTGKFHTSWGEFGGYKRPVALEYECAAMAANGARCSVGDQLHPSGLMEEATYALIRPAYERIEKLEPYLKGAVPVSEIAVLSAEACRADPDADGRRSNPSDEGAARMLLETQRMFDVIDAEADFAGYRLLVLPDAVILTAALAGKVRDYVDGGGALILSGASGLNEERTAFAIDLGAEYGGESPFCPDYIEVIPGASTDSSWPDPDLVEAPFVVNERARAVKAAGAEVLAGSRVPYFNRRWDHFCSHRNTPYALERNRRYDAAIRQGAVVYFSHPIFRAYRACGQPLLKYLFRGALNLLLPDPGVRVVMPSSGRMTLMRQAEPQRLLLHLLFAQTQLRGAGIEIIEDAVPIYGVPCEVRADGVTRITSAYTGEALDYGYADGKVRFTVPKVNLHELIVIE